MWDEKKVPFLLFASARPPHFGLFLDSPSILPSNKLGLEQEEMEEMELAPISTRSTEKENYLLEMLLLHL